MTQQHKSAPGGQHPQVSPKPLGAGASCTRKACRSEFTDRFPPFFHVHSKQPYCVRCARKINEAAGQELCVREQG